MKTKDVKIELGQKIGYILHLIQFLQSLLVISTWKRPPIKTWFTTKAYINKPAAQAAGADPSRYNSNWQNPLLK